MEKRRYRRIAVHNMRIDISDGLGCSTGTVRDISRNGMRLDNLATRFGRKISTYILVTSIQEKNFKFRVYPRWEESSISTKTMGVEIAEVPRQWLDYIATLESRQKKS